MDPGTALNKRKRPPNDLAALRQKQLRKRQADQSQGAVTATVPPASSLQPIMADAVAAPADLGQPGSFFGTLARRPPMNSLQASEPQFTLFGKAPAKVTPLPNTIDSTSDADAVSKPRPFARQPSSLNPFSNHGTARRDSGSADNDERPKIFNPFQRFASKIPAKPPAELDERSENRENESVEVPVPITEMGFHVESALASASRNRAPTSASDLPVRTFSRSYSTSSILLSPRVKVAKKPAKQLPIGQISFASRYKDSDSDQDGGFSSDNQDLLDSGDEYHGHTQGSQDVMSDPELDAEEREATVRRQAATAAVKEVKKRKKKKSKADSCPDIQEDLPPEDSSGGSLLQLLNGKRMVNTQWISSNWAPCSNDETIHSCLYHWAYPAEKLPPSHIALMAKVLAKAAEKNAVLKEHEQLELDHFQRSEQTWKEAFQSAYTMLRKNKLDHFYYVNSEFSVLFYHKDTGLGVATCSAVMSTSTSGLRKHLDAEDIGFLVVMPKGNGKNEQGRDAGSAGGTAQDAVEKPGNDVPAAGGISPIRDRNLPDPTTQTYPLRFDGSANVHRLFAFLLGWTEPRTDRRAEQLPILLSLGPFLHSQIKSAKIIKHEKVRYNIQSSLVGSSQSSDTAAHQPTKVETWHKLVIDGYVLPTALSRLLATLRATVVVADLESQTEGGDGNPTGGLMTGTLRSHERTLGLNLAMSDVAEDAPDGSVKIVATVKSVALKGRAIKWK
ncbi:hypothetical protein HDU86_003556 [Geranomyces michiganensis]|nr:hypothetical protein HDU86_003556 [Geranomyces michiganensis]